LKKKLQKKTHKNHLRSNYYEACTAVARFPPNILDVMALENVNLSSERPPIWSDETDSEFC
jgi:hypothetical protein